MNGQEIMNTVISYSTDELDSIKTQMATVLDKMTAAVPTLKGRGMSSLDIKAQADTMIRQQFRRILNGKDSFFVERNGQKAIIGLGQAQANMIVDLFERKLK